MSFQPVVPFSGYQGWLYLSRTQERQQAAFEKSPAIDRAVRYFRENIQTTATAADLVQDRRLLEVALGAFGLEDDLPAKAFIQKILEGGTLLPDTLASRLADKRYAQFAREFGYGDFGPRVTLPDFADNIVARYLDRKFEAAVGAENGPLRQALNFKTAIADILESNTSPNSRWFAMMGNLSLRKIFESALGLPSSIGRIDIDQQLNSFQQNAQKIFGTQDFADFADPAIAEKAIRLFLVRSDATANSVGLSSSQTALSLLALRS